MSRNALFNAVCFLSITGIGFGAGAYGYSSPCSFQTSAQTAVSSLSIIFGLSVAISSLLHINAGAAGRTSNDPATSASIDHKLASDDDRTLRRLMFLHVITLCSILLGLVYLVAIHDAPSAIITKAVTSAFVFCTAFTLLSTLFLPSLLVQMVKRNTYIKSKSAKG